MWQVGAVDCCRCGFVYAGRFCSWRTGCNLLALDKVGKALGEVLNNILLQLAGRPAC